MLACGPEHLARRQAEAAEQPFVPEQLWAAKVTLAVQAHPRGLSSRGTGLTPEQIRSAVAWHNTHPSRSDGSGQDERDR